MKKHSFYIQFLSDREPEVLQRFIIKSLENTGANITHASWKVTDSPGRKKINRPKIKQYIQDGCKGGEFITIEEVSQALQMTEQAVGKVFRELVRENHLVKSYTIGQPAQYEVIGEFITQE
jgi:hypothetical protein